MSLEVMPGTVEADIIEHAAVAAMYEANERHFLPPQQEWAVRRPLLALRRAGREVRRGGKADVKPVMIRGDAAAAALEGLVALQIEAHEKREQLEGDHHLGEDRLRAFTPSVGIMEERARMAEKIEGELFDQAAALGESAIHAARTVSS